MDEDEKLDDLDDSNMELDESDEEWFVLSYSDYSFNFVKNKKQ